MCEFLSLSSAFGWRITGNASTSKESAPEKLSTMRTPNENCATDLCDALARIGGLQLRHSECVEVLSKLKPGWAIREQTSYSSGDRRRAEQFVDQLYEGMFEPNYAKFTQLFEPKFLVHMSELDFQKNMREEQEKLGAYIGREFMGSVRGTKRAGDDRYPNLVRYLWRCFFDKSETLLRVGIYEKDNTHFVSGVHFV